MTALISRGTSQEKFNGEKPDWDDKLNNEEKK
jgi:hypothetical protein